jgi:hypothetical protein
MRGLKKRSDDPNDHTEDNAHCRKLDRHPKTVQNASTLGGFVKEDEVQLRVICRQFLEKFLHESVLSTYGLARLARSNKCPRVKKRRGT